MKRNRKLLLLIGVLVVSVAGVLAFTNFRGTRVADNKISATVTSIIDKPNQAEDGYYEITVKDAAGRQYKIDATGYLNTPASPEQFGDACVDIPTVKVGDEVAFNLPKSENQSNLFLICYKSNLSGYYFTLVGI